MSIKVALLKSGEEVIADIKSVTNEEEQFVGYYLKDPYILRIEKYEVYEDKDVSRVKIKYIPWLTLSKEKTFLIPNEWIVTFYDPVDTVMDSYLNRTKEEKQDEQDGEVSSIEE